MRKYLKAFLTVLFFFFVLPFKTIVSAEENKIIDIAIDVHLREDGSAIIQEKREMETHQDTELYIELSNLGASELTEFELIGFEEKTPWEIDASFEEKAYKYGVITKDEGYELAWGISEYGVQEYNLTYGLTNLVRNLEGGQSLFWNFDTFLSLPTDRMTLKIRADFDLSEKLLEYYAFGFEGPMEINEEGAFEWTGYGLDESNQLTVLLQFPENTFQTSVTEESTLDEQKDLALKGSSYNEAEPMPKSIKIFLSLIGLTVAAMGGAGITYALRRERIRKKNNHFRPHTFKNKTMKNISNEAPRLEASYEKYAWLLSKLSNNAGGFSEFFFLYLILWAEEEKIKIDYQEEKLFLGSKKKTTIQIIDFEEEQAINILTFPEYLELYELDESQFEEVIWGMLLELADSEGKIKGAQIEKWTTKHADKIEEAIELLEERSKAWLESNDYLNTFSVKDWGSTIKIEQLTKKGEKIALEMIAYQNYIKQLKENIDYENENWEQLMVWAILFGLAESTIKKLEELDPAQWAYLESNYPYYYGSYYGYHHLYTRSTHGLASGGYSASGGGFSSGGGGMGAGGGGGGGSR